MITVRLLPVNRRIIRIIYKLSQLRFTYQSKKMSTQEISEVHILNQLKQIVPKLTTAKRKGQDGRIGVIGGSLEYTGAPYFAAISALKVGADLVHVFCSKDSSTVIKSYSPELIVHPLLDVENAVSRVAEWLDRMHVIIIGPGLGREPKTLEIVTQIIDKCRELKKPLVIDADGLFLVANNLNVLKNYPLAVLTPNAVEFARLLDRPIEASIDLKEAQDQLKKLGDNIVIVRKGAEDRIFDLTKSVSCTATGSGRRCGGQGDLLSGSLGTFLAWSLSTELDHAENMKAIMAAYGACRLTRECNALAFSIHGRSMTTSDMIEQIHCAFSRLFENK